MIEGRRARILLALVLINMVLASLTLGFAENTRTQQGPTATRDPSTCIPVEEAVNRGQVRLLMISTGASPVLLDVTLENLTSAQLKVCLGPMLSVIPIDPQYPRAVITDQVVYDIIRPGDHVLVRGYFTDNGLQPPPAGVEYRLDLAQVVVATATSIYHWCGIPVEEAMSQGLVRVTLTANGNLFFRDPLRMDIENLTSQELRVCLRPGLIAVPVDSQYQRIMITEVQPLVLAPNDSIEELHLFAECIDEDLHPPDEGAEYRFEMMADGDLLGVANAIDDRDAQGRLGSQMATWAVTDEFTLDDLADAGGSGLTSAIQPLLCLTTGEVELAQQLLEDAGTALQIYTSENPEDFCQSQGIPTLDQLRNAGTTALRWILIGLAACVVLGGGGLFLLIRALRARG